MLLIPLDDYQKNNVQFQRVVTFTGSFKAELERD